MYLQRNHKLGLWLQCITFQLIHLCGHVCTFTYMTTKYSKTTHEGVVV